MKNVSVRTICIIGMFVAIISVLSIIAIPTPWGVPFTLQTFAVALSGFVLGEKCGTKSVLIYILLGFIGVPVYAGMNSGPGVIFGVNGGFLWGFICLVWLCGVSIRNRRIYAAIAGVILCHLLGVIQMMYVLQIDFLSAFLTGSIPYILKDIVSVLGAYVISVRLLSYSYIQRIIHIAQKKV